MDVILDLMVHDLDIILHFVRSPVETVDAVGVSVLSDKVDIANARLTFASGCVANITASRVTGKIMQKIRFFGVEGYHAVDFDKRELVSLGRRNGADGQIEDHGKSRRDPDAGSAGGGDPLLCPGRGRPDAARRCRAGTGVMPWNWPCASTKRSTGTGNDPLSSRHRCLPGGA